MGAEVQLGFAVYRNGGGKLFATLGALLSLQTSKAYQGDCAILLCLLAGGPLQQNAPLRPQCLSDGLRFGR